MALKKCENCGNEISDKALKCVHCGYDLSKQLQKEVIICSECGKAIPKDATECQYCGCPIEEQEKQVTTPKNSFSSKTKKKNKKIKPWLLALIIVGIVLLLLFIGFLALGASVSSQIKETKDNITPYLDYIGKYVPDDEYLDIDDDLYKKKDEVFFMGMKGFINFYTEDNYVYKCTWDSDEEFREEDYQKKIDDLYVYFGEEPTYDTSSYHTGDTYFYYWTDPNNNFSVTCSRDFFGYDSPGRLEISWEAEGDVLEEIKEIPDSIKEETDEEKRAEADDYNEFKYAVDVCIEYVPDCMLDLDYTDNDTSYSINLDDEIIGILGTKMDSWDAVALTDPDKEDALLHHEQISIALIMACDSDITYEEAKKIFDEANKEGSARISSGIYFFEGIAEGMYAGGVDITWLN
ncbi:MAG: zinc ribbon domain-containing protein [Oscillospiraceae bacterium]|nr:zinc ribbon domain-containing protein [Oscillospiraceae bacterium]